MEKARRFTLLRVGLSLIALIFCSCSVYVFYTISECYKVIENYSGAVSRGDQIAARDGMKELEFYYAKNSELTKLLKPLRFESIEFMPDEWVDKHIFQPAQVKYYQSAYDFLVGRHEKIGNDLKEDDGYWGYYIRANAKWRQAQAIFRQSLTETDAKLKADAQKLAIDMAISTKDDYGQAIIKRVDPIPQLPASHNYDMTTDPAARMRGLMPKPIKVKVKLGEGKDGEGPEGDDGDGPKGKGNLDLDKKKGEKSDNNKSGTKREG